ncbi:hypothetical protein [Ensifer oleiphilus]|jgi:hypothetical protein|uniref:hypothetical protein n=1 Tax=Ensifer oleiphilus TaxID=2742698 RepID=UPI001FEE6736|nr:hypothetical protein [Ensifer oleiphilus]
MRHDIALGCLVERRTGFVEKQEFGIVVEGDGDTLTLAARKLEATFADRRVDAAGKA